MFRIDTSVRSVIAILILTWAPWAASQSSDNNNNNNNGSSCPNLERGIADGTLTYESMNSAQRDLFDKCMSNSNDSVSCSTARSKYNAAKGALSNACSTLGGENPGIAGWPLCTRAINQCDQCPAAGPSPNPNVPCDDIEVNEEEESSDRTTNAGFGLRDIKVGRQLLKYCPGKLGPEQKELEKQMQESQKEVRRLEGELPKLQSEYTELVASTEAAVGEIVDQMTEAQNQFEEQMEQAANAADEGVRALQQRISELEEQIARADDNIRQVELTKTDAYNTYTEALKQVDLQCHASAAQTVSRYQQDRLELERNRQFNRASFNNMMRQVGVSDRDAWQRVANRYYQWCLNSKPTKDSKDSARKIYESALTKANEAIAKIERDKVRLRGAIDKIQNNQGCNPNQAATVNPQDGETDVCRQLRVARQAMERLQRQYNNKVNTLNRKVAEAQRKGAAQAQAKLAEANLVQQQLGEERMRLQNLKQYLELAYQAGGGSATDAKAYTDAKEKYSDFVTAASVLASCNTAGDCERDSACRDAAAFLNNIQMPPSYKDAMEHQDTMAPLVEEPVSTRPPDAGGPPATPDPATQM